MLWLDSGTLMLSTFGPFHAVATRNTRAQAAGVRPPIVASTLYNFTHRKQDPKSRIDAEWLAGAASFTRLTDELVDHSAQSLVARGAFFNRRLKDFALLTGAVSAVDNPASV